MAPNPHNNNNFLLIFINFLLIKNSTVITIEMFILEEYYGNENGAPIYIYKF
jgi:hypothetical protein